jgi:hypothetical protein
MIKNSIQLIFLVIVSVERKIAMIITTSIIIRIKKVVEIMIFLVLTIVIMRIKIT